ncbi:hypothetical protein VIGAN_04183200 [Vigna angularis var. angularis]|uniref:Helicase ATP-binding domain-containing protein n=1 Tax=Vigna angularis var. angularis TaxID=157739 RepID=A0A0S3RV59_PHAAN|nr:hypothetical protein VIGAN_04183200 [Vigna angularis var. angularis]
MKHFMLPRNPLRDAELASAATTAASPSFAKTRPYRKHKHSKENDPPSNPNLIIPFPAKFKSPLPPRPPASNPLKRKFAMAADALTDNSLPVSSDSGVKKVSNDSLSRRARHSQRHEGQKLVKASSGWRGKRWRDGAGFAGGRISLGSLEVLKIRKFKRVWRSKSSHGKSQAFRAVLEPAMQGHDMIGRARTGIGKTLTFGIPILDRIIQLNAKHGRGKDPLAMVLAPSRELARHVEKEFDEAAPSVLY